MLTLTFVKRWPASYQNTVERAFGGLQSTLGSELPVGVINLKLVDDTEIAALNQGSTGKGYPTDVLTFNYQESGTDTYGELADIVISTDTAARQAKAAGTPIEDEIALLATHGILHTLGYDHAQPNAREALDELQATIMGAAGLSYRDFKWTN